MNNKQLSTTSDFDQKTLCTFKICSVGLKHYYFRRADRQQKKPNQNHRQTSAVQVTCLPTVRNNTILHLAVHKGGSYLMQSCKSIGVGGIDVRGQVKQTVNLVLVARRHGRQEGAVDGERDGLDVFAYGRLLVGVRLFPSLQLFGPFEQRRHAERDRSTQTVAPSARGDDDKGGSAAGGPVLRLAGDGGGGETPAQRFRGHRAEHYTAVFRTCPSLVSRTDGATWTPARRFFNGSDGRRSGHIGEWSVPPRELHGNRIAENTGRLCSGPRRLLTAPPI